MKRALAAVILATTILLLAQLAAGQSGAVSRQDLIDAISKDDAATVRQLLERGANIEAGHNGGYTPLQYAVFADKTEIVRLLVAKGANIEAKDSAGNTPLLLAAGNDNVAVIRLLLEKGANIEAEDNKHLWTALRRAAYRGQVDVVKLLLEKGANIEARDKDGRTALNIAVGNEKTAVVKLLLEKGADVESKDNDGRTAIKLAEIGLFGAQWPAKNHPDPKRREDAQKELAVYTEILQILEQARVTKAPGTFNEYVSDFKKNPTDEARREKLVKLVASLPAPPAIPEDARQLFLQASALIKQTTNPAELARPIELLRKALLIAPWWGNAYYNLSRALELSGQYDEATKQLNYYLMLKPPEAEAAEARAHISVLQVLKEEAGRKKLANESVLAVKYVSGGAKRLREGADNLPAWWYPSDHGGIAVLYVYSVPEEMPFCLNAFQMPNNQILAITLEAHENNGAYAGDGVRVSDITNQGCTQGSGYAFGEQNFVTICGSRYSVDVSRPPNPLVTVKQESTGAGVTIPVSLLYRGRALKGKSSEGKVYQGGKELMLLHFDPTAIKAAEDPNVNALGLTPTRITPR